MRPVLWWSNSPTVGTGYGSQTAQVVGRMAASGAWVEVLANYGVEGAPLVWQTRDGHDITVHPRGQDAFSRDVLLSYWYRFVADHPDALLFGLADCFVIPDAVTSAAPFRLWTPVEHTPLPPDVLHIFEREGTQALPIAMSQFGQRLLADADIEAPYIPHGLEPTFQITDGGSEVMGVPDDAYVVVMVQANKGWMPERKQFSTALVAFQTLAKAHDDALLYIHADPTALGSVSLKTVVATLGLQDRVVFPDPLRYRTWGYNDTDLAAIYTRANIILAPSMGEGFGLTPLEAAACGTPAIVSDFSAQPELACEDSYLVSGQLWWHEGRKSFLFQPSIESIREALEHAYQHPVAVSQHALDLAAQYAADRVWADYWIPYLASID